jgi:hypothetical protein
MKEIIKVLVIVFTLLSTQTTSEEILYPIYENGVFSYINADGEKINDMTFDEAYYFSEGLAVVKKTENTEQ